MNQTRVFMFRYPETGGELPTRIEMDTASFQHLPVIRAHLKCPVCSIYHLWSSSEAWPSNPAFSAPALPGLLNHETIRIGMFLGAACVPTFVFCP